MSQLGLINDDSFKKEKFHIFKIKSLYASKRVELVSWVLSSDKHAIIKFCPTSSYCFKVKTTLSYKELFDILLTGAKKYYYLSFDYIRRAFWF